MDFFNDDVEPERAVEPFEPVGRGDMSRCRQVYIPVLARAATLKVLVTHGAQKCAKMKL
jgi:hypothetical protein